MTISGSNRSRCASLEKRCLITVGATAPFQALIEAVLQPDCLTKFKEDGFTHITFQCGDSLSYYHELAPKAVDGLELNAFAFKREGLRDDILKCKPRANISEKGLVISHAGAGTILDVMRMGVPLIVVPNASLLDNHQDELAIELQKQGYATHSAVTNLVTAIDKAGTVEKKVWSSQNVRGVAEVANDIVGYEDDISARLD